MSVNSVFSKYLVALTIVLYSSLSQGAFWCEFETSSGEYYSGDCQHFLEGTRAEGNGTLRGEYFEYDGEWRQGVWHGQGSLTFTNGDKYIGEFREGKFHYLGTYTWSDGSEYVGEFKDSKRNGYG